MSAKQSRKQVESTFSTYGEHIEEGRKGTLVMWERPDAEELAMLVLPFTYCPNVADLLDESNWATIKAALVEVDPDSNDHQVASFGHWATPYDLMLVRAGSEAHTVAERLMASCADYPVMNEEDFSEREYAAQCEGIADCIRSLTIEDDGSEVDSDQLAAAMFSDMWEHDQGALEYGHSIRDTERDASLERLGYVCCDDDVWRPVGETDAAE